MTSTTARRFGRPSGVTSTTVQEDKMFTTTRTTTMLAADFDLSEPASHPLDLDALMARENALVDVWDTDERDGEAVIALLADAAVVEFDAQDSNRLADVLVRSSVLGWGRELPLPESVTVTSYDGGRPDFANPEASIFAEARRERFGIYRLLEQAIA